MPDNSMRKNETDAPIAAVAPVPLSSPDGGVNTQNDHDTDAEGDGHPVEL